MDGLRFPAKQAKAMFEVGAAEWIPHGGVRAAGWGRGASDTGAGPPGIKTIQGGQVSCQRGKWRYSCLQAPSKLWALHTGSGRG